MRGNRRLSRIAAYVVLGLFSCVQLFPLVWMVNCSLAKSGELFGKHILFWPDEIQWQNYVVAWVDGKVPQYLVNSVIVNVVTVILTILFSLTMSYAFTRMQWKYRQAVYTVVLLGMMIPIHATLLPNFVSFRALGILDSYLGLIVPYVGFSLPIATFLMCGFIESIPRSIEESVAIDGGGIFRIIFQFILPLMKPAVVTVIIMTFISTWNEFIMAATYLSSDRYRTLPFAVWNFAGQYASRYSIQFAVMTLVALPSLLVYIAFSERITKGVTIGALKE